MTGPSGIRRLDFRAPPHDGDGLHAVRRHLERGRLLTYPTETVYGFGCAVDSEALHRLSELKGREADRPFLLLVPSRESVADLRWTDDAVELAQVFWPGALTLVLGDPGRRYPDPVRGPTGGVAVRRTPHPVARAVVESLGGPLTSTSANPPGGEPARTADEAARAAEGLGAGEEMWLLDGGTLPPSEPSTIVDCTGAEPTVLRAGAVPVERLRCVRAREP